MTFPNPYGLPELENTLAANAAGTVLAGVLPTGLTFLQGLFGGGPVPVLAAGAGAGGGASVGSQRGHDLIGSFVVTTAGSPAAGALATVTFGTALPAGYSPAVLVTCWDNTGAAAVAVGPTSISNTGFTVSTGAAATTAHGLLITYLVGCN
jgi:hypothetical protein